MSDDGNRTNPYRLRLGIAGASGTLFSALVGLAQELHIQELWLASSAILTGGAVSVVWLTVRANAADAGQHLRDVLEGLVTGDLGRVPRLSELSAYDLGTDPEAIGAGATTRYLPRDKDGELDDAIARARTASKPSMVVLRGPSKSGKSRALYEAANRDQELREAAVLAPRNRDALACLLNEGPPLQGCEPVVLWLDDLERFVSAGNDGIDNGALDALRGWQRPVVVLATAGGKGAELLAEGLAVPIRQLYSHRRVCVVSISSELTARETTRVRERYEPTAAQQIVAHGIGEYLVAAPELARKLEDERHAPGDEPCPEGAAVAWAAIDWARCGMLGSVPDALLRELWPLYLHGIKPTEERFNRGLDWALRPVYHSVALVYETSSYEPYDWIVAHASCRLKREVNKRAWQRIVNEVDATAAFDLGVAAYDEGSFDESARAFTGVMDAADERVAANAAFNLGYILAEQGDVEGARAAYRKAIDSSVAELAAMAGLNLGILLQEQKEVEGAASAYRDAMERRATPHSGTAALNLGLLLIQLGDEAGASLALEMAAAEEDERLASRAQFMLGSLLEKSCPEAAADALRRAVALGDHEIAPSAARLLERLLEALHPEAPLPAGKTAAAAGDSASPVVTQPPAAAEANASAPSVDSVFDLALRLDEEGDAAGARRAYERVIAAGAEDLVPAAAFGLAVLLQKQDDDIAARRAYEMAIESGHPRIVPAASLSLGSLLARMGDVAEARTALMRAAEAGHEDIARAAGAALHQLDDRSMEGH